MMVIFIRSIVGILMVCCLATCGSSEKAGEGNGEENSTEDGPAISNEKFNSTSDQRLAPGTVKVRIELKPGAQENSNDRWHSVVKKVFGYGSATPPLSVGTELVIQTKAYFSNTNDDPGDLMARESIICIIQHQETMAGTTGQSWRLVDLVD